MQPQHPQPFFRIPEVSFPYLNHCEFYHSFSPEEIQQIRDLGDLLLFQPGQVGNDAGTVDEHVRNSKVAWIDDNGNPAVPGLPVRLWLINKMANIMGVVNRDKFQMTLDGFNPMQYTRYALNEHYDWHMDVEEGREHELHRKLSASLILSNPDEYEGGELELNLSGNPENSTLFKPQAGTIVLFRSNIAHRVRPVTSGLRESVVLWAMGPKA